MGKRLFVAIDLPDSVNRQLADYAEVLRDIKWNNPSQYHLTLKFIGDTESEQVKTINQRLADIQHPPFSLTINRLGYFPPDKHPRVIWAGFESSDPLHALHDKIETTLADIGIAKENRSYVPHITLGKNKGVPKTRVETFIERRNDIWIADVPVKSFILYSSELTPQGALHTPEARYELGT